MKKMKKWNSFSKGIGGKALFQKWTGTSPEILKTGNMGLHSLLSLRFPCVLRDSLALMTDFGGGGVMRL